MSSEDTLRSHLSGDTTRTIARYCKDAHSASEIIQHLQSKFSSLSMTRDYWERVVGDGLPTMEKVGALAYKNGKWEVTRGAVEVLEKYFGGL